MRPDKPSPPGLDGPAKVSLVEEELQVGTREVVTDRIRISTVTDTRQENVRQELSGQRVEVERVPIERLVEAGGKAPAIRVEGDVTIVPVTEEVLFVEKRLLVKEELRVTRRTERAVVETEIPLRKQRAVIERHEVPNTAQNSNVNQNSNADLEKD